MSEELKRLENALREDEGLAEKFEAEYRRLSGGKTVSMEEPAYLEAAKSLGFSLTRTDLDVFMAEKQELDLDAMGAVTGGQDHFCGVHYNCYTAFLHDEHTEKGDACWKDYDCVSVYHGGGAMTGPDCKMSISK